MKLESVLCGGMCYPVWQGSLAKCVHCDGNANFGNFVFGIHNIAQEEVKINGLMFIVTA